MTLNEESVKCLRDIIDRLAELREELIAFAAEHNMEIRDLLDDKSLLLMSTETSA